ncbi:MAG: Gfo/Idh/MocA family protein [Saccharofermentanales bacterium]
MSKLRAGIIGCGGIANAKHLPGLAGIGEVEMVAFCDIILSRAQAAADKYQPKARVYENYMDLLKNEKLDVVHVCTPNRSHSEITVAALDAGCHVMCEKPMAISEAEAGKMLDAARRTGKKLTIGYQNRYRADSQFLKKECESGALGEIYFAKAHALRRRAVPTWGVFLNEEEQGGGPLIDIGTHALDLTLWTMDNYKPRYCVGKTFHMLNDHHGNSGNAWGNWDVSQFTVEDSAFGFVVMENGALIYLESSWALNTLEVHEAVCSLCGTLAGADMNDGLRFNGIKNNRQYVMKPSMEAGGVAFTEGNTAAIDFHIEARQWIRSIIDDKDPCVLPEQAYIVSAILDGIYQSSKTGKPFYFDDLKV